MSDVMCLGEKRPLPPSGHLPPLRRGRNGRSFFPFPYVAGEGAEGGRGRSWLSLILLLALPLCAAAEDVQLRMSWWGGNDIHRTLLESVRRFEERNPGIRVKTEYTGWVGHLERITTQIAGGTAPDLMQINWNWLVLFSRDGNGFQDLRKLDDTIDLGQFDKNALAMGTVDGKLNALSTSMAARLFYFNATTFEKAGLQTPTSWNELLAAGPIFRERLGPDYYPLDLHLQDVVALTRSRFVQQTGKPLIDEVHKRVNATPQQLADMARFYQSLVDAHVTPNIRVRTSYGHVAPHEMRPWIDGRFAGTYQWISAIGKFMDTLAPGQTVVLASYPLLDGAADAGLLYRPAMMYAINAKTKYPRESALLMDFLLNDPVAVKAMGLKRGVPVSQRAIAALTDGGAMQGLSVAGFEQVAALPHGVIESAYFEHARVRDAFIDAFELFAYGRIDADAMGQRLHDDLNRILARTIR
jgi:oligogalacturonide transport system substrate-binding protein